MRILVCLLASLVATAVAAQPPGTPSQQRRLRIEPRPIEIPAATRRLPQERETPRARQPDCPRSQETGCPSDPGTPPSGSTAQTPQSPPFSGGPEQSSLPQPPAEPFGSSTGASANYQAPVLLPADGAVIREPGSYVPGQLLVWHTDADTAQAFGQAVTQAGYRIRGRIRLDALGVVQTILALPPGMGVGDAATALTAQYPEAIIDANHRYRPLAAAPALAATGWQAAAVACAGPAVVGVVDTAVDSGHPLLAGRELIRYTPLPAGLAPAPVGHGTAVAGRLAALLPQASLRLAAVFRLRDGEIVDTTAAWLLQALDWLARQRVMAINLSLGGPPNRLLALAVQRLSGAGIGLVAAVAEAGPTGPPAYPAAYPGVIGVTAVDADLNVFVRARHGAEVDFAGPGVDLRLPGFESYLSGTSHAAPFVTAALVTAGGAPGLLRAAAADLGAPGRDDVFGAGLVRFDDLCAARGAARAGKP